MASCCSQTLCWRESNRTAIQIGWGNDIKPSCRRKEKLLDRVDSIQTHERGDRDLGPHNQKANVPCVLAKGRGPMPQACPSGHHGHQALLTK